MTKQDRLGKFFGTDGRTVIVPLDHAIAAPSVELHDTTRLIESLNPYADGYVLNLGLARACAHAVETKGVCLRTDLYRLPRPKEEEGRNQRIYGAKESTHVGAHAVMNMCFPGHHDELRIFGECANLISECQEVDVPVILEVVPCDLGKPEKYTIPALSEVVRFACEIGADVVKTAFPTGASAEEFHRVIEASTVPVIILGGSPGGSEEGLFQTVATAIEAGAAGTAIGRGIWKHRKPAAVAAGICEIVHRNATVVEALDRYLSVSQA